jgi:hypothetical protein
VGQEVGPLVGKTVTIDGTIDRTAAMMPAGRARNTYCLTVPPGSWPTPIVESTLHHGRAPIAFTTPVARPGPAVGERVRVTGRLHRVPSLPGDVEPTYELRGASWRRVPG